MKRRHLKWMDSDFFAQLFPLKDPFTLRSPLIRHNGSSKVLIMVFTGVLGNFTQGASECKNKGGFCTDGKTDRSCGTNIFGKDIPRLSQYDFSCKSSDGSNDEQYICCLDLGKKPTPPPSSSGSGQNTELIAENKPCPFGATPNPCQRGLSCQCEDNNPTGVCGSHTCQP